MASAGGHSKCINDTNKVMSRGAGSWRWLTMSWAIGPSGEIVGMEIDMAKEVTPKWVLIRTCRRSIIQPDASEW